MERVSRGVVDVYGDTPPLCFASDATLWAGVGHSLMAFDVEQVRELPVASYRGREVTGFEQDDAGVDVALSDGATLRARYLVGCDGGRSRIRKQTGIAFSGWDASASYLIAEAEMAEEPAWGVRRGPRGLNGIAKLDGGNTRARLVLVEPEVMKGDEPTFDMGLLYLWRKKETRLQPREEKEGESND